MKICRRQDRALALDALQSCRLSELQTHFIFPIKEVLLFSNLPVSRDVHQRCMEREASGKVRGSLLFGGSPRNMEESTDNREQQRPEFPRRHRERPQASHQGRDAGKDQGIPGGKRGIRVSSRNAEKHFPALFRTGVPQRIRQFRRRAQPLRKSPADPGCRFFLTPQRTPDAAQPLRTAPEQRIP